MLDCPYCNQPAKLVTGETIYPHRTDLWDKKFWQCAPCEAYVGCHKTTGEPLGRLANAELRKAKMAAHGAFDPLWREGFYTRGKAYEWLAGVLGLPLDDCHIGMFDVEMCDRVVEACKERFINASSVEETLRS